MKLYQDFAWQAVTDNAELSTLDLFGRPQAEMAKYADAPLVALVMNDRACSRRTQGVCNLDFMAIWDSQDPVGTTVKLSKSRDSTKVLAELTHLHDKSKAQLTYSMTRTPLGWRIADIAYSGHESLLTILRKTTR